MSGLELLPSALLETRTSTGEVMAAEVMTAGVMASMVRIFEVSSFRQF
jgi:hypothetical protein